MGAIDPAMAVPVGPTRAHSTYCGGSDAPALLGLDLYKTALGVWAEKVGKSTFSGNDATEAGNEFERPICNLYQRKLGCELQYTGTLFLPDLPHIGATPDAIRDGKRTVQVKMVGYHTAGQWGDEEDGPEGVPPALIPQVHQESAVTRRVLGLTCEVADVVAQIGTERRVYEIPIDHEFGDNIITIADDFWQTHVVTGVMPLVTEDDKETLGSIFREIQRETLAAAPPEVVDLIIAYDAARSRATAAEKEKQGLGAQLQALIGHGLGFELGPHKVTWGLRDGKVSWEEVARSYRRLLKEKGVDADALDAAIKVHTGKPYRQLDVRVKGSK